MGQTAISNIPPRDGEVTQGYEYLARANPDGKFALSVLVGGAHCAACIHKIENVLKTEKDVTYARLNFSTGKLSFEWDGPALRANDFVTDVENLGYTVRPYDDAEQKEETDKENRFLLLCLGVAGFAMGNIMLLSVGLWTTTTETMGTMTRDFMHWISALIAIPTILFSGRPFFRSAFRALSKGQTNMDVPISIGLTLTLCLSLYETATRGEHAFFDSAVMLVFFLLIGRYLDFRARKQAQSSAADLLAGLDGFARVYENGKLVHLPIRQIVEGHRVQVAAGEKFPVDGVIEDGSSDVDLALVTGESVPAPIMPGQSVYAGTLNLTAPVIMRAAKGAENSLLADLARLMEQATQGQAKYVRIADRAARLYTPVVHSLAALAFLGWWLFGGLDWQSALVIGITVLIITCPCALGLAVPVVQVLATSKLMKAGILVKSGDALERLASIDTIFMDKTGTLTLGRPDLVFTENERALPDAAALAAHSRHPLSIALAAAYQGDLKTVTDVKEYPGNGLEGRIDGKIVRLGRRDWCGRADAQNLPMMELWFQDGDARPVLFGFSDTLRVDAPKTVMAFQKDGLRPVLLSGDRAPIVEEVAKECGIDDFQAHMTPQDKYQRMEDAKTQGHRVLMVGDGLNDAPTLAGATVSIAPGTAIGIAQNTADIVFMGDEFMPVYDTYRTALFTQKLVRQNFTMAVLYNIIAIPLAVGGFVTPLLAAAAMSGSSLLVIANSFRLRFSK